MGGVSSPSTGCWSPQASIERGVDRWLSHLMTGKQRGGNSLNRTGRNDFLGRMRRKRLDGEAIRDAMLTAAGQLNLEAGGPRRATAAGSGSDQHTAEESVAGDRR